MILIRDELASANSLRAQVSLSSLIIVKYVMIDFSMTSQSPVWLLTVWFPLPLWMVPLWNASGLQLAPYCLQNQSTLLSLANEMKHSIVHEKRPFDHDTSTSFPALSTQTIRYFFLSILTSRLLLYFFTVFATFLDFRFIVVRNERTMISKHINFCVWRKRSQRNWPIFPSLQAHELRLAGCFNGTARSISTAFRNVSSIMVQNFHSQ